MFSWSDVKQTHISELTSLVHARQPCALSRWGDGEWFAVLDKTRGANCDGHPYSPELQQELRAVLASRPPYWLGMQQMALESLFPRRLREFIRLNRFETLDWRQNDIFHHAASDPQQHRHLSAFFAALRGLPCVIAGPMHALAPARSLIATVAFVDAGDAFNRREQIVAGVNKALLARRAPAFVAVSAGMTANLIVDRLWRQHGDAHFFIDVGALWDAYAGVHSRSWMRKAHSAGTLSLPR